MQAAKVPSLLVLSGIFTCIYDLGGGEAEEGMANRIANEYTTDHIPNHSIVPLNNYYSKKHDCN